MIGSCSYLRFSCLLVYAIDFSFFLYAVCGDSLKKILDSGVRDKMNKAMMFLVKKSASGAVDNRKAETSRTRHSVSIEVLDSEGKVVHEDEETRPEENVDTSVGGQGDEVMRRKRLRTDDGGSKVPPVVCFSSASEEVGRTLTIVGGNRVIMTPTRSSKEVVEVSIQPHERWGSGSTVPLRAFQIFNLPQDLGSYIGRTRNDLVDRCLVCAGRVIDVLPCTLL